MYDDTIAERGRTDHGEQAPKKLSDQLLDHALGWPRKKPTEKPLKEARHQPLICPMHEPALLKPHRPAQEPAELPLHRPLKELTE